MKLKTYRAPSMADALSLVKKDLGKDAVILHTRSVKIGGVLGFGAKNVVEITASDETVPMARQRKALAGVASPAASSETNAQVVASSNKPAASLSSPAAMNAYRKAAPTSAAAFAGSVDTSTNPFAGLAAQTPAGAAAQTSYPHHPHHLSPTVVAPPGASTPGSVGALSRTPDAEPQTMAVRNRRPSVAGSAAGNTAASPSSHPQTHAQASAPLESSRETSHPSASAGSSRPHTSADRQPPLGGRLASLAGTDPSTRSEIHRELAEIKLLVNQVLHAAPTTSAGAAAGHMPPALFNHYLRLLDAAVSRDVADRIIGAVRDELTPGELVDESIVRATVLRHIAGMIPVAPSVPSTANRGPTVIALVGPTGVGKTTTIAKLAAAYKLRHGKTVGLITSDTYRIAAVDQLRTYAGIIGLPLKVVLTPKEMTAAVASLSHLDVILIDTAGRSQFNADRIAELQEFLDAANPHEVHLVLSTTAAEPVLLKTAEAFAAVKPQRVILTKLDEAVNFGVLVNVAQRVNTQLSFITMGQEVPDHLEPSHPDRLARMILDNKLIGIAPAGSLGRMARVYDAPGAVDADAALVGPRGGL